MAEKTARDTHAAAIKRIVEWTENDNFQQQVMRAIRTRCDHLDQSWAAFGTAHNNLLLTLTDEAEQEVHHQVYVDTEERYLHAAERLNERLYLVEHPAEAEADNTNENESGNGSESSQRRDENNGETAESPVVQVGQYAAGMFAPNQIPWQCRLENTWGEFDGNYMKWPAFHDSFMHAVYKDKNIPLHRKLQLLKSSLKGRAERAFGEWLIRDHNFEPAWTRLKELFDDQYRASKELLNRLIQLKKLDAPHGGRLQTMSNTVQEVVRQLEAMGYPSNEMTDMIFIHVIHEKMDPQTSIAWDKYREQGRPKLIEMKKFLDREAKALCNAYESTTAQKSNDRFERKRSHKGNDGNQSSKRFKSNKSSNGQKSESSFNGNVPVKHELNRCAVCQEDHLTRKCQKFKTMTLSKKKEKAREAKICFNCLLPGHSARECVARPCSRCKDKKHNDLLCDENPQNRHLNVGQVKTNNKTYKSRAKHQPKTPKGK